MPTIRSATIRLDTLERIFQIFEDTKKRISYDKSTGTWSWYDRSEEDNVSAWHNGFKTAMSAMEDAVEPYLQES